MAAFPGSTIRYLRSRPPVALARLRRRLIDQAGLFDNPGAYRAGVNDALDAVIAAREGGQARTDHGDASAGGDRTPAGS